nr:MarR family transcriptional regulator [uncultured Desulfobulbus sp.]
MTTTNLNDCEQSDVPLAMEESLPVLMATCVKCMRESLNARFAQRGAGISSEQWIVLTHLTHQDGISQQELATRCSRTEVSVFNLLKKLESSGFVLRLRDPVDARCKRVFLTSEGRKQQRSLLPVAQENMARMCAGVGKDDLSQVTAILQTILLNAQQSKAECRVKGKIN